MPPRPAPPAPPDDVAFADDVPWLRRVAWPQVLTLGGIALVVLVPLIVALVLAA